MDQMSEQVTVGLPVYNGVDYIEETLQCILKQSYRNLRVIVSDNCSTDGTDEKLKKLASLDKRIELHQQSENIGANANFEYVIKQARTKWFMFAAHDDKWSPNYIEVLMEVARGNLEAEFLVPQVHFTFEDGKPPIIARLNERMFDMKGCMKVRAMLKAAHGSWLYGIHRTESLIHAFKMAAPYKHVWAMDLMLLLPYIFRGNVFGSNDAVFSHLETPVSRERYRPATVPAQFQMNCDFRRVALAILHQEVASRRQRCLLLPTLLAYSERHSFRLRRVLKNAIKAPFVAR